MPEKNQASPRLKLILIVAFCTLPSLAEAAAVIWGERQGYTGKALRDGLDFWAGGFLYLHHQLPVLLNHTAYQSFLQGMYGHLPYHLWSYPPSYGLIAAAFGWLSPWAAVLSFDALSLVLMAAVLRLARKSWWFIAAMLLAPATLENALEHQNAALMTALIGGGLLLAQTRPRLGGALIGLASFKPQLGLVLPLYLLRHAPLAFFYAALAAVALAGASLWAFGQAAWAGFYHYTSPIMSNVLLTGQPKDFAGGLISVFATTKPLAGLHGAFAAQAAVTLACVLAALFIRSVPAMLIFSALASPYLHVYDLLGTSLAVALLVERRLAGDGFKAGEPVLFFLVWFGPGLLPWHPAYAHLAPVLLLLLLASAMRRGGVQPCDSSPAQPGSPALPAGPLPIPAPPESITHG
ncbi:MAG: DUF2029 domain-containing protein [Proteobacteria bacterium]|nr:DUF2029 domain-containing protein [Pseudomonadota bacterium]MBU6426271.1 DUF2029 domain-containing protein [Rhodospirillales bacterium]